MTRADDAAATPARGALARLWSGAAGRVFRVALAVLPLLWLSRQVRWRDVLRGALALGPGWLCLAIATQFCSMALGAVRWRILLRAYGADPRALPPLLTLLRHCMVGQYFAMLPTGIVGEAVRGMRVAHCLPTPSTSYVLLFVERLAGLLGLLILATVSGLFAPTFRAAGAGAAMRVGFGLALALTLVGFALPQAARRVPAITRHLARIPVAGPLLARIPAARDLRGPALAVLLSVFTQALGVLTIVALIAPLDPAATLAACFAVVPAIVLVMYVPLTPGGVGQREVAFVQLFALVGVGASTAVAASMLLFVVAITLALIGGAVLLYERARAA